MNFSDALLDQAGGRVWSLFGGVWVGGLGCLCPWASLGVVAVGGFRRF